VTDLRRAAVILDAIAEGQGPLTLTALAARTTLARSTVHRVVQALEGELFVIRAADPPGYVLGPGLLKFGLNRQLQLMAANRPQLIALARQVNENAEMAVFSGREVVVVDQVASPARLQGVTQVGKSFSLHASAIGMALLAQLPGEQVNALLPRRPRRFTEKTVSERSAVFPRLEQIRLSGVAIDVEEHDLGICAAATALVGPTGVLQAVAVVVPTHRFHAKAPQIVASLRSLNPAVDEEAAMRQLTKVSPQPS